MYQKILKNIQYMSSDTPAYTAVPYATSFHVCSICIKYMMFYVCLLILDWQIGGNTT